MFFFSSRRRHTRWTGDWSSDVCSSDLSTSFRSRDPSHGGAPRPAPRRGSVDILPVLAFHQPGEPAEHQQKQHHPYAESAARRLRRLADVVEEVHRVAHEAVVLRGAETPRCDLLEVIERLLVNFRATLAVPDHVAEHRALEPLEL